MIAPNFVGMGLPDYLWYQMTNLLYKVSQTIADDLICEAAPGGICKLSQQCSTYTNLWSQNWGFKIQFTGETNMITFPLGALAEDVTDSQNNKQCHIYLQYLNSAQHTQSEHVIFGSLFMQQFVNYWKYDLSTTAATPAQYKFYKSQTNSLTGSYIGAATYAEGTNPFTLLHNTTQQIYINADEGRYKTTVGANLGFQGRKQFQVSLLGHYLETFAADCLIKGGGTRYISCTEEPVLANNYFNSSVYYVEG